MSGIMNMFVATKTTIATAVDAFFNSVSLLLNTSSTNGAQNNTFLDSSTNNFTITRNGNTSQGTFTPFSQTGWSNYFNGSSQLSTVANPNLAFGTGAITFECWINTLSTNNMGMWGTTNEAAWTANSYAFNYYNGDIILWNNSTLWSIAVGTLHDGNWHHIAIVRSGTTWQVFADGVSKGTTTTEGSRDLGNNAWRVAIGQIEPSGGDTKFFIGYLSNMRVSNTAIYTSNFTPSTTPLTTTSQGVSSTNVKFLSIQSNRFVDNSTNATTFTVIGTPSVQAFSPFLPTAAYDTAVVGGSGYFDGTGDYLSLSSTSLNLGSNDFTIETWVYATTTARDFIIGSLKNADGTGSWVIMFNDAQPIRFFCRYNGGTVLDYQVGSGTFPTNQWVHLAVTRSGANLRVFQNGTQVGTTNTTLSTFSIDNASTNYYVGSSTDPSEFYTGYLSCTRLLVGTALYTTTFTPPTAPPTAITNTSLLLNYTNAGIYDSASKNVLETVGNAQVSTTQAKWGTTAISFDGTGDTLNSSPSQVLSLGSGNWTIECWVRLNATGTETNIGQSKNYYTAGFNGNFVFRVGTSNLWRSFDGQSNQATIDGSFSWSTGVWYHVAWVRNSGTVTVYRDGTSLGSVSDSKTLSDSANGIILGSSLNAYIDDLRITVGLARYTTTFTPPTAAFPLQ